MWDLIVLISDNCLPFHSFLDVNSFQVGSEMLTQLRIDSKSSHYLL